MARSVILGNGRLTVGLNENGLVHDFYYPYVGLDNLTTARSVHHKIGVWIDGTFSWVDDGSWEISTDFEADAMVSNIHMQNEALELELSFSDFVDHELNAFVRSIKISNNALHTRDIRLFMHQVFQISRGGRADTALYEPDEGYILDYKGRCCLLIYARTAEGQLYDQFAVGNYGIEGKEGTFRDAEDGELSGSAVEHGGVDSTLRFGMSMGGGERKDLEYWIIAADSQFAAEKVNNDLKQKDIKQRLEVHRQYWRDWLAIGSNGLHSLDSQYLELTKKSLMLIKVHCDERGGIIASCDSSIYNSGRDYYSYVWPRDGAYALWPLIRLGYTVEAKKFFAFCRDTLTPEGYLAHKYQPDRAIGSTWHPLLHGKRSELAIQEDETAGVIFMLGEYLNYSHDEEFVRSLYDTLVKPAANFLNEFIDEQTGLPHASYDLWEMKFYTTTYTTSVVYQALLVASEFAEKFEYPDDALRWKNRAQSIFDNSAIFYNPDRQCYRKGFLLLEDGSLEFENTLDVSSLYGPIIYGFHREKEEIISTLAAVESYLLNISPSGGAARFEDDGYFRANRVYTGNPWIITTFWMAQFYIRMGQPEKAVHYIDWGMTHALSSGMLPEQVNPDTGYATSVTPLVWSHAEFINTVLDLAHTKTKGGLT